MEPRFARVVDARCALQDVVAEFRSAHPGTDIREQIDVACAVDCDIGRIQQLLSNLLGNALSHGDAGRPVDVEATTDTGWLSIRVTNEGEPIAEGSLARLFEPYWRPPESKPGGGLGLGLYICLQIVEAHGGTLEVSSTAQTGAAFTARIPITR